MAKHIQAAPDLDPDYDLSVEFLRQWADFHPISLCAVKEGLKLEARVFDPNEPVQIKTWIERLNRDGYNIYFTVNAVRPNLGNRKPKKTDIAMALGLHVDIDRLGPEAFEKILKFRLPPTALLMSGGGYQAFYRFQIPIKDFWRVEDLNKALSKELGGDACHNIDRLMRVPGTINWPNAKKRKAGRTPVVAHLLAEHTDFSRTYSMDALQRLDLLSKMVAKDIFTPKPDKILPVSIKDVEHEISDRLATLIRRGDDPDRPRGNKDQRYASRSEAVFAVATMTARAGLTREDTAGLLLNPEYGISASIMEKPDPETYAWRQADKAAAFVAAAWPDTFKGGAPKPSFANALLGLRLLEIICEYDLFRNRMIVGGHGLQDFQGEVTDNAAAMLRKLFLDVHGFDPGKSHLADAAQVLCLENRFHPIRDYLDGLDWDGIERLERLFIDYMGAVDSEFIRHVAKLMMVAAVRRVRCPGCKFDFMVVFEGPQGSGKSTAIVILAGQENFSDQHLIGLDDKTQMEQLEAVWLYEIAELDGMSRADISKIKAFITRTEDRARRAYAMFKESWPRQGILIGTTNEQFYLKDQTGNRRFLPVKTEIIDLGRLRNDRDQLWAEAAALEAQGFSIELPHKFWKTAAEAQDARMQDDPWLDILANAKGVIRSGVERISTVTLLGDGCLGIPSAQQKSFHPKRVATLMRELGWDGPKKIRIEPGTAPVRGYERPSDEPDTPEI